MDDMDDMDGMDRMDEMDETGRALLAGQPSRLSNRPLGGLRRRADAPHRHLFVARSGAADQFDRRLRDAARHSQELDKRLVRRAVDRPGLHPHLDPITVKSSKARLRRTGLHMKPNDQPLVGTS